MSVNQQRYGALWQGVGGGDMIRGVSSSRDQQAGINWRHRQTDSRTGGSIIQAVQRERSISNRGIYGDECKGGVNKA